MNYPQPMIDVKNSTPHRGHVPYEESAKQYKSMT